jgi:SAM-dependent methyltransferase
MKLAALSYVNLAPALCPCCGYSGKFWSFGIPMRPGALCPSCDSLERHRLLALAIERGEIDIRGRSVLHFAPEKIVTHLLKRCNPLSYVTSSWPELTADISLNIEDMDLKEASVDVILCFDVLEHVDDRKAFAEVRRVLSPNGFFVFTVPYASSWKQTYENEALTQDQERLQHFGGRSHLRFYGRDITERATRAGLKINQFVATGEDSVKYRVHRGETLFIAHRHA